jgi:prepilin-type N-terminal cleavage/methylation domain-containing protein
VFGLVGKDQSGFSLVETIAVMLLLLVFTAGISTVIRSADQLFRRGKQEEHIRQSLIAAAETIKGETRLSRIPSGCGAGGGNFPVDGTYWATYTCSGNQKGLSMLYKFDVRLHEDSPAGAEVRGLTFYATKGGY